MTHPMHRTHTGDGPSRSPDDLSHRGEESSQRGEDHSHQGDDGVVQLTLYVAGDTELSRAAIRNVRGIVDRLGRDRVLVKRVDILQHPEVAWKRRIVATPILIRESNPVRKILGDLSDGDRVVDALQLNERWKDD